MNTKDKKTTQESQYAVDATWTHLFKSMVLSGDAAELGGSSILVYVILKSFTDFNSGESFPAISTISKYSNLGERQIIRCLKSLAEFGYLEITKQKGKKNTYKLKEKIHIIEKTTGKVDNAIAFNYVPSDIKTIQKEIREYVMNGFSGLTKNITIENLNVTVNIQNIHQGDGNVFNLDSINDPGLRKKIENIELIRQKNKLKSTDGNATTD